MKKSVALIIMITVLTVFMSACHHRHRRHRGVDPDERSSGFIISAETMSLSDHHI